MFDIELQLQVENSKQKPDKLYVDTINILKAKGELTRLEFSNTGRFCPRNFFLSNNPDVKLHDDCTDVVVYLGGFFIEALKGNTFLAEADGLKLTSKSLDNIEAMVWDVEAEKFFNGTK